MLAEATKLSQLGKPVIIIATSESHAKVLREKVDSADITVMSMPMSGLDWSTLQLRGFSGPDVEVLVDHFAIETHLAAALSMLTRWDDEADWTRAALETVDVEPNIG